MIVIGSWPLSRGHVTTPADLTGVGDGGRSEVVERVGNNGRSVVVEVARKC